MDFLLPVTTFTQSIVQKTMIFVDTVGEGIAMAKYLQRQLPPALQSKAKQIVRTFYADLDPHEKIKILEDFMNGDIRILICTNAAAMGVNIPDIKRVIQWKIFDFLTLATLVQCIGRAGRDPNIRAVAVVFVEKKLILPNDMSKATADISFARDLVTQDNEQATRLTIKRMYEGNMQIRKEGGLSPFHCIDPPLLWYINTLDCRRQLSLACFVDDFAFHLRANESCCDNCNYQSSNPVASVGRVENDQADYKTMPNWKLHEITSMHSLRYLETREWKDEVEQKWIAKEYEQRICKEKQRVSLLALAPEDTNTIARTALATANIKIIEKSLDTFAVNVWPGGIDTIRFPHEWRWKLAKQVAVIETVADLAKALRLGCDLKASVLHGWTDQLLFILHSSWRGVPIAVERRGSDRPGADSQAYYAVDGVRGLVPRQQNLRTQVQEPIIGQARRDVLQKQATQAGMKKVTTVAKKAEKVKEKQIAMQRDNAKRGRGQREGENG